MPRAKQKEDTSDQKTATRKSTTSTTKGTTRKPKSARTTKTATRAPRKTSAAKSTKLPALPEQVQPIMEEISVAGSQLVDRFKAIIAEGNVRRVVIKHDGNTLLEVPLTAAIAGGVLATWAAPLLTAVTAVAGAVSHIALEVERTR